MLGVNFLSSSASARVDVQPDGVYVVTYWWQLANYDQHIIFCEGDSEWT